MKKLVNFVLGNKNLTALFIIRVSIFIQTTEVSDCWNAERFTYFGSTKAYYFHL